MDTVRHTQLEKNPARERKPSNRLRRELSMTPFASGFFCAQKYMLCLLAGILIPHILCPTAHATSYNHYDFLNAIIPALIVQESTGNPNAVGDMGNAVGLLQIWPCVVADVNRILGRPAFSLESRWHPGESRAMCRVYLRHYVTADRIGHTPTLSDYARIWNGGPDGYLEHSTLTYWRDVSAILSTFSAKEEVAEDEEGLRPATGQHEDAGAGPAQVH